MSPKSHQKGIVHLLVLLLVIVGIGAAGYLYLSKQNQASPSPTQAPSTNDTSNWKTYTNDTYGFEFNYPQNAELSDNLPKTYTNSIPPSQNLQVYITPDTKMSVYINPDGFGPAFTDKTYYVDYSSSKGMYVTKSTNQDVSKYRNDNYIIIDTPQTTRINDLGISITFRFPKTEPDQEILFTQILSTFRFNAPTSSVQVLDLSKKNLSELPIDILKFTNLTTLYLNNNKINTLPREITQLNNLKLLDLTGNPMTQEELKRIRQLLPKTNVLFLEPIDSP